MSDPEYEAMLEEENEKLRERVRSLEELVGFRLEAPLIFGLTPQEARLFGMLMKRDLITKEMAMTALYSLRSSGEEVEIKIIDVFICKIRAKLEKFGVGIETKWGQGYYMTATQKAKANEYLGQTQEAKIA